VSVMKQVLISDYGLSSPVVVSFCQQIATEKQKREWEPSFLILGYLAQQR